MAQKRANQPPASTIGATAPRRFADLHQMSSSAVLLLTPSPSTATFAAQRSASERAASRVAWQSLQPRCKCDRVGARRASFAATSPRNFAEFDANAQRGSEKEGREGKRKNPNKCNPSPGGGRERVASRVAWQAARRRCKCDRIGARCASFASASPGNFAEFGQRASSRT